MGVIAETFVRVRPDTSTFQAETQTGVRNSLGGLAGLGRAGIAARAGLGVAASGATLFALAAREAVGGAASLERELNVFEATSDATAEQMAQVAAEAKRLGADLTLPAVSAGDAGRAFTELAKGGLSVQDTLGGARGVLQLAAAGGLEVAEAAGIAAQALNTFRLPGEDATRVADLLAAAANSATGEVSDFAIALSQSGAVAAQANISIDDTVTSLALLAKNGLLGSDAGTSLRTTLLRLIPQTEEASDVVNALGIDVADAAGNLRPLGDIFEDYRQKLALLTPVQQQQALTTIFGTDAIRAAAILTKEGAAGFDEMRGSVTEQGAAADLAAARTDGLAGAFGGLKSNAETLATTLGQDVSPTLTTLTEDLSAVVGAAIEAHDAIADFWDFDPNIVGGFSLGDLLPPTGDAQEKTRELLNAKAALNDVLTEPAKQAVDFAAAGFSAVTALTAGLERGASTFAVAEEHAHTVGRETGRKFQSGISEGIESAEQLSVRQARSSLAAVIAEGREAVAEAIRQGDQAVQAATAQAKQNLVSIATDLAGKAAQIIDQGPLARRIAELQATLATGQNRGERSRLREALQDAQRELEEAQGAVSTGGRQRSAAQQEAVDEFLQPFQRKVRDAKAALSEFNTEGVIAELEKEAAAQKKIVADGIADLVIQFNQGKISLQQLSERTGRLLKQNGVSVYGEAGRALGAAFRTKWLEELEALRKQALQVRIGPASADSGLEPNVVSVGDARAGAARGVRAAQQSANERRVSAQEALARAQRDYLESISGDAADQTKLLREIRDRVGRTPTSKTSGKSTGAPVPIGGR